MTEPDPPALPFRHLAHRLRAPEQFGIAFSGARMVADFLSPQSEPTVVEQFQAPGWTLDFQEAHVKARVFAPLPDGWVALGLMRSSAASSWCGVTGGQGLLVCNPPGEPIDGWITPGFSCVSVSVPLAVWERCRALAGTARDEFGGFAAFRLEPPVYQHIKRQLLAIRPLLRNAAESGSGALAAQEAAGFAAHLATTAWELSGTTELPRDSYRNRIRLARRAEEWMHGHLAESFQMPDLCVALHVSRRELEYAFRTAFDQSPQAFLQALRLNAIRRALRRSRSSVTRVALDHGVTHLSRFAMNYRSLFGESPSLTEKSSGV